MTAHPAAPLLAADFGKLPHTNANGERGLVQLPGFSTSGMSPEQAEATGTIALGLAEAIIEDLQEHGYPVLSKADIKSRIDAAVAAAGGPAEPQASVCKDCRQPLLKPGNAIHVPTMISALQQHLDACPARQR